MWSRRKEKKVKDEEIEDEEQLRRQYDGNNNSSHSPKPKHIVILGSGFAGVEVLKRLQKKFKNNEQIEITLVSRDNFLLFTPMLPEVASG
ncbi:MAG TPA: hypothetical protein VE619_09965, partial [Nitrososphaeraceae archaeon]|nr:hypothetical protein [Nitrososphaeraceae archaeon]